VLSAAGAIIGSAALVALGLTGTSSVAGAIEDVDGSLMQMTGYSPSSHPFSGVAAVGALFPAGSPTGSVNGLATGGTHFCTASVVDSPAGDLAVTAAHCVTGTNGPIVFVPGYHDGQAPYGTWLVTRVFTDAAWASLSDPDNDVAFLRLAPNTAGASIQSVTGGERLVTGSPDVAVVKVIGYPNETDTPVWCVNWTHAFSRTQLVFDCGGYPDGTSGGPFLIDVSPATGKGSVIGVIGGYQQGGDTEAVSYSIVFGATVASLFHDAEASE
jgi:V8-like Glu-specific endopeptidase